MAYRTFTVPRNIFYGPEALERLASIESKRAIIVTDPNVRALGLVGRAEKILRSNNVEIAVFDGIEPEPPKSNVLSIFALAQDFKPDLFIGLGGGSSIDGGKGAWALYEHPDLAAYSLQEIGRELHNRTLRHKAQYVAIPTTSGTGSEVTGIAVFTERDATAPFKIPWQSPHLVPDVAIVDPELAASMPREVTANTGSDALVHALECYIFTTPSDLVDSLAIGAARSILEWLPRAMANGKDMEARDKMHLASLQAGMAFANGTLGLVHQLGDIDAVFNIPHGRANIFMLCSVLAFIYPTRKERFGSLATSLGIAGRGYRGKTTNLLNMMEHFKQKIGIPLAIKDTGIDSTHFKAQLDYMANNYMNNTHRSTTSLSPDARRAAGMATSATEVKELFMHAWNGTRTELL